MASRQEIKEGMADILDVWMTRNLALATARTIMAKEHSQGVVIKVITHESGSFNLDPLIKDE